MDGIPGTASTAKASLLIPLGEANETDSIPGGLATGIGSLPFLDSDEALHLILTHFPQVPHWPQLPRISQLEFFTHQSLYPLVELGLVEYRAGRNPRFLNLRPDFFTLVANFYERYMIAEETGDLSFFAVPNEAARGFYAFEEYLRAHGTGPAKMVKGQLIGPVTAGFQLLDERGQPSFYDDQLRDILTKALAMNAAWQVHRLSTLGLPVVIFVDDSFMYVYGTSNFLGLTRESIQSSLLEVFSAILSRGGIPGSHICSSTDWSILLELPLKILNLDAYNYFPTLLPYTGQLGDFLNRGGIVAWGIIPTSPKVSEEDQESLIKRLSGYFNQLERMGIARELLYQRSWLTPSCGTGLMEPDQARRVYQLSYEVYTAFLKRSL